MKRTEKNRGAAMVIVLCVMVVFLALSTTVILAGSVALNTARNNVVYERGKVQAASLSELFVGDLVGRQIKDDSSSLLRYVRDGIMAKPGAEAWPPYDEKTNNRDEAVRTFSMDSEDGSSKHQITIEMYWTWEGTGTPQPGDEGTLNDNDVRLFVDVISTLNDIEYHVKREFRLETLSPNTDTATLSDYPYQWGWTAMGRSSDRGKDGGA